MLAKLTQSMVVVLSLSSAAVFASEQTAADTAKLTQQQAVENIERIDVTGSVPLLFYKDEMKKAELDFYDAFNALNDNKKYAITCRLEQRQLSRIKYRVCYPQYVLNKMAQETQDILSSGGAYPTLKQIEFAVKDERAESMLYVEELVKKNPALLDKLIALNEKKSQYEEKRAIAYPDND